MVAEYKIIRNTQSKLEPISRRNSLAKLVRQARTRLPTSMSTHQYLTKFVVAVAVIATTLTLSSARVNAETKNTNFEFGPGTDQSASNQDTVTLNVPARTTVKVSGVLNPVSGLPVMVVVEVIRPQGGAPAASVTLMTLVGQLPAVPIIFPVESVTGFSSQVGCPSTWTVRVKTLDGTVPSVGVSGGITFDFQRPGTINLDMVGDPVSVNKNASKTVTLSGHDGTLGIANNSLIAGTGTFRIKAKWDTDPGDWGHIGQFFRVNVQLLKPNGANADNETGRSQHYTGTLKKVDFSYTVTPADAALTGPWKLKIRNTVGSEQVKIVNFDIENFAFPSFKSTFQAQCN